MIEALSLIPLSIWDPFISIGSAIMSPLYWVVSGILVLFHTVWSPVFGPDSGWTWALSIISLTVVIRSCSRRTERSDSPLVMSSSTGSPSRMNASAVS